METILLHSITADELRLIIREEIRSALQQDQLLTKEGAIKMVGISSATFTKAINEGVVKPQLIKGYVPGIRCIENPVWEKENTSTS